MDDSKPASLTTTSYAILGQLSLRSWTAYELTKSIRRNFHYFWPRAESHIYSELKRLVNHDFATGERSFIGRRGRTTYAITSFGEQALQAWLATPPTRSYELECEGLLRVFVGAAGTRDDLLATLDRVLAEANELLVTGAEVADEFIAMESEFQHLVHLRALVFDFLSSFGLTLSAWAERSRREVERWSDLTPADKTVWALRAIEEKLAEYPAAIPHTNAHQLEVRRSRGRGYGKLG